MPMDSKDKNIGKNKQFISSIEFAFTGIKTVFKEERNMRKHVALGIVAIIAGFIFRLSQMEWLWLLLAVFLVWIVEIINTVFENVVDMFTDFHFHPIGKKNQRYGCWCRADDRSFCVSRRSDHLLAKIAAALLMRTKTTR